MSVNLCTKKREKKIMNCGLQSKWVGPKYTRRNQYFAKECLQNIKNSYEHKNIVKISDTIHIMFVISSAN